MSITERESSLQRIFTPSLRKNRVICRRIYLLIIIGTPQQLLEAQYCWYVCHEAHVRWVLLERGDRLLYFRRLLESKNLLLLKMGGARVVEFEGRLLFKWLPCSHLEIAYRRF